MPDTPLNPDALEAAAREAFWTDDQGGHIRGSWTWDTIPEVGRENFRTMVRAAVAAYLAAAQPEVNSVESIPAQVQVISWEEEPEHECWKLAPDETFVGLIVKSDRAWSPADKYTLSIERPGVDDA